MLLSLSLLIGGGFLLSIFAVWQDMRTVTEAPSQTAIKHRNQSFVCLMLFSIALAILFYFHM